MSDRIYITIGRATVECSLALTQEQKITGLQKHSRLSDGEGMLFVFDPPRTTTFWMGSVAFPIDIVGLDAFGRANRIVEAATPGSMEHWLFPNAAAVLEVPAGFVRKAGFGLGQVMEVLSNRFEVDASLAPGIVPDSQDYAIDDRGEVSSTVNKSPLEPMHETAGPEGPGVVLPDLEPRVHTDTPPLQRYKDQGPPGEGRAWTDSQTNDAIFQQTFGYDPVPEADDNAGGSRMGQVQDEDLFVEQMANVVMAHGDQLQWAPDLLNGGSTERCVVTRRELAQWFQSAVQPQYLQTMLDAASSQQGMDLLGDAFVAAGIADLARVGFASRQPSLILYKGEFDENAVATE